MIKGETIRSHSMYWYNTTDTDGERKMQYHRRVSMEVPHRPKGKAYDELNASSDHSS